MTARKPKPVRAWAIDVEGDPIDIQDLHHTRREARNEARALSESAYPMSAKPVRVTIVPDGTPSQAAEVRRLRRALRKVRDTIGPTIPRCCAGGGCEIEAALSDIDAALRGGRGR